MKESDVGRMDKMMWRNDWKRNVYWKENRKRRNGKLMFSNLVFTAGRSSCLSFGGFWEFHFQFVVKLWCLDVSRHGLVCLKVTECFFDWWGGHEKGKRWETGNKKSCRIVNNHVLAAAACPHRLTIHLVHSVFSKKYKQWKCIEGLQNREALKSKSA